MNITIIIPTYNEEHRIEACLRQFLPVAEGVEIMVVDGQSTDQTPALAGAFPHGQFIASAQRGRAIQMNAGAEQAHGDWLLFLHADCQLPDHWLTELRIACEQGFSAGCFRIACGQEESLSRHDRFAAALTNIRSYVTRFPYGDQAIFVRQDIFRELGGYQPLPLMEDYDFSLRLHKRYGPFYQSKKAVKTSFRRFKGHVLKTALIMFLFPKLFRWGVNPEWLAQFYKTIR